MQINSSQKQYFFQVKQLEKDRTTIADLFAPCQANALPTLQKKLLSRFLNQKHVRCATRASNFFPQAVLHN